MPSKSAPIFVAGHNGMVGSAIVRSLTRAGYSRIQTAERRDADLRGTEAVSELFAQLQPAVVVIAAARVGGIHANDTYPADFIYDNLMIECNCIHQAFRSGVERLVFLGSSCIYPRLAEQPMQESSLLAGPLEPTNEPYAVAKIAGIKLCESYNRQHDTDFRSLMPTNLYGPGDNFHPENSHVIPALIRRIHEAKQNRSACVDIWGSGQARREFLHVDDLAEATRFILELDKAVYRERTLPQRSHINVGTGTDTTIAELAQLLCRVIGYEGQLRFDTSKPDGTPRKLLDTRLINSLGWHPRIELEAGLTDAYRWFLDNLEEIRR